MTPVDPARPVAVVLAPRWESGSEEGWVTRQVAGALACAATVHVVTPQGTRPSESSDGVFTVHALATPISTTAEIRRDLLVEAFSTIEGPATERFAREIGRLVDKDLIDPWNGASEIIDRLQPDLVLVAGYQQVGACDAVDRVAPNLPVALLALGSDRAGLTLPHYARVFDRADTVLAVTETERLAVVAFPKDSARVHRIGIPAAADPSVRNEPNTWVGDTEYILVVTGAATHADEDAVELATLLRLRFPDNPVGIVATDAFSAWHRGRVNQGWAVKRRSDLSRLMAWAAVMVDLRPGSLVARRCVDSLLYGTPIVVPHDSVAREHAERGRGGLWFASPGELAWCVEAMLDRPTRACFAAQGTSYAEEYYGSTDAFIDRVLAASGADLFSPTPTSSPR